jgi:hypothetical protein
MHLFYSHHLPLLLIGILLTFLACLVEATNKTFDVAFMSKAVLVMLSRRDIVCNINVAIFAEIAFLRDPIFAHWSDRLSLGASGSLTNIDKIRYEAAAPGSTGSTLFHFKRPGAEAKSPNGYNHHGN